MRELRHRGWSQLQNQLVRTNDTASLTANAVGPAGNRDGLPPHRPEQPAIASRPAAGWGIPQLTDGSGPIGSRMHTPVHTEHRDGQLPLVFRTSSNPAGCTTLCVLTWETPFLWAFASLASANNPPKPLLTVLFRQPTANKTCGSFFGQNDSLVAVSANGFVVRQDSQEEVRNASRVDFVHVRECILHLCIRDGFCFWVCLLEVCQNLPEQQTLLIFGDVSRWRLSQDGICPDELTLKWGVPCLIHC
jgi:hypothetical protein